MLLGVDGISDFNGLHSRRHDDEVQLYAFDVLALEGEDLRKVPLHLRKTNLARLLARRPEGIFVSEFERGEIGPDLFRKACKFGLEGLVSKRRDRPYRQSKKSKSSRVERVKERLRKGHGVQELRHPLLLLLRMKRRLLRLQIFDQ